MGAYSVRVKAERAGQAPHARLVVPVPPERLESGEGTLGRLMEDPALYEETQAAISTLRRLMADMQANPAKYIGAFKLF